MHKKAIFIPLLLLVMQSGKLLGADSTDEYLKQYRYKEAKKKIELLLTKKAGDTPEIILEGQQYYSSDPDINELLEMIRQSVDQNVEHNKLASNILNRELIDSFLATGEDASGLETTIPSLSGYYDEAIAIIRKHYRDIDLETVPLAEGIKG